MSDHNVMQDIAESVAPSTEYEITYKNEENKERVAKFTIYHWTPTKTYKNIPRIGRIFGVPMSMIMSGGESFSEALPGAMLQLFNTFEEEDLVKFLKEMLDGVYLNGEPVNGDKFDAIFAKNPQIPIQLLMKVLEISYSPFTRVDFSALFKTASQVTTLDKMTSPLK